MLLRGIVVVSLFAACSARDPSGGDAASKSATSKQQPSSSDAAAETKTDSSETSTTTSRATTTIRVHYAGISGPLTLRGAAAGLAWTSDAPLRVDVANTFTWESDAVTAPLEVKPLLGGTWSKGPNYRVAPGATVDLYPRFSTETGAYEKTWPAFTSTTLPSTRGVWVYLPPTYLENTEARFPVVYMHDGQNLFSKDTAYGGNEWKVDEAFDAGAADGSVREAIVVGIESTARRIEELTPTADPAYGGGKLSAYLTMVQQEIKPLVDSTFRTLPERETTAMMGSSLGGLASVHSGVVGSDVFGIVGAMSPSTWWDGRMILGEVAAMKAAPGRPLRVYLDCGDSDDGQAATDQLAAGYRAVGYSDGVDFSYVVAAGGMHSEVYWSQRLPAALAFMLGKRADLR